MTLRWRSTIREINHHNVFKHGDVDKIVKMMMMKRMMYKLWWSVCDYVCVFVCLSRKVNLIASGRGLRCVPICSKRLLTSKHCDGCVTNHILIFDVGTKTNMCYCQAPRVANFLSGPSPIIASPCLASHSVTALVEFCSNCWICQSCETLKKTQMYPP